MSEDLIPIGDAARRLGVAASALRYYDERGLVRPALRRGGRRLYGPEELRRLAFIQIARRLGIDLDDIHTVLHEPGQRWQAVVRRQIAVLDQRIREAQAAREQLGHALECPASDPVTECPYLREALDQWLRPVT